MATNYPGSLDSGTQQPSPSSSTEMDDSGFEHDVVHTNHSGAIIALETKVGTGDSNAVASSVLAGTGSGTSGWTTTPTVVDLTVTGDIGIGETSPETPLHIVTANRLGSTFTGTVDGEGLRVDQSDYSAGNYVSLVEASYDDGQTAPHVRIGAMFDGGGAHLAFGTSNNFGNGITNTAMFIDETGKVGINTTSPTNAKLHIVDAGEAIRMERSGYDTYGYQHSAGSGIEFRNFSDSRTEMIFAGDGRVGIGSSAITARQFSVRATQTAFAFLHDSDVSAGGVVCGIMQIGTDSTNPGTNDYWILFRHGGGSTIGSVRGTGSASVNFSTTSDETLKTDRGIASASRIGTIIDGLRVHEFDWNEGDLTDQIGLFAQEAIAVLPESICNAPTTIPGGVEEGESEESAEDEYIPAALDYSKIVPILIAECQFLRARVAALEAA